MRGVERLEGEVLGEWGNVGGVKADGKREWIGKENGRRIREVCWI